MWSAKVHQNDTWNLTVKGVHLMQYIHLQPISKFIKILHTIKTFHHTQVREMWCMSCLPPLPNVCGEKGHVWKQVPRPPLWNLTCTSISSFLFFQALFLCKPLPKSQPSILTFSSYKIKWYSILVAAMKKAKLWLYLSTTLWIVEVKLHTFIISMLNVLCGQLQALP